MNKNIIYSGIILSLVFLLTKPAYSQVKFEQNPFEKADPYQYQSVRNEFWKQVEEMLLNKKYDEIIKLTTEEDLKKIKPNEKAEIYLAVAEAAVKTDHPYLAFMLTHEITKICGLFFTGSHSLCRCVRIWPNQRPDQCSDVRPTRFS